MHVSTKGRYALRFMGELGELTDGRPIPLRVVAENQNISEKYLEQIVRPLVKANLVESSRGVTGGYRLAAPADQISVGQVLRCVEGDFAPAPCVSTHTQDDIDCTWVGDCNTAVLWKRMKDSIDDVMDSMSIADLLTGDGAVGPGFGSCPR